MIDPLESFFEPGEVPYKEWHSFQMGVFVGVFSAGVIRISGVSAGAAAVAYAYRYALGVREVNDEENGCDHNVDFQDVREEPRYFALGFLISFVIVVWILTGGIDPGAL